jgi:cytochrome P450
MGEEVTNPAPSILSLDPEALRCPHFFFDRLTEDSPAAWVEDLQAFAVTGHADVLDVLRQPTVFSSRMGGGSQAFQGFQSIAMELYGESEEMRRLLASTVHVAGDPILVNADPPAHTRQRALVNRAFTPRKVKALETDIRNLANRLVDGFATRGYCEFVDEFAVGLPLVVIVRALGLPESDLPILKQWSDDVFLVIGNHRIAREHVVRALHSQVEMINYFSQQIAECRRAPRVGFINDLVCAGLNDDEPFTEAEMIAILMQFLTAGNETTTKLLASSMLLLLRQPDLLAEVRADYSLIPALLEEALRLEPPVLSMFRQATEDTQIGGVPIPAGSDVWMIFGSANRDESEFSEPPTIDLTRPNAQAHLAFGHGAHYCLGAALSRAEGRIALETLFDRLSDIKLGTNNTFAYEESYIFHGLKELHLTFRPV